LKESILNDKIDFSLIKNEDARKCLEHLLEKDVSKRATLKDLIECGWVTKNGEQKLLVDVIENDFVPEVHDRSVKQVH
jgi:hypothetical protein